MLSLLIPASELFNNEDNSIINTKETTIQLEHSLVSIAKWEAKWGKPFLSKNPKSTTETYDYIRCMTITQNVDPNIYLSLSSKELDRISEYIDAPMTATVIADSPSAKPNREIITAELIYFWMINYNIPFECQKWHINRLLTLVKVCSVKNNPPKKMSKKEILERNRSLNAQRRKALQTKG